MEKIKILDILLSGYNDGRKKTLFCVAVNLLNLQELKEALREIESKPDMETLTLKEKSAFAAGLLQEIASRRKVDLKLHRKTGMVFPNDIWVKIARFLGTLNGENVKCFL